MWGRVINPLWGLKAPSPATKKWIFEFCTKFGFRNHLQTFWPRRLVKSELSLGLKGTKGINEKLMRKLKRKDTLKARKGKYLKMKSENKLLKRKKSYKLDDKTLLLKPKNKLMTKLRRMVNSRDMSIDIHIYLKGIKARKTKCKINR